MARSSFLTGVRLWKFVVVIAGGLSAIPIAWQFLREYQKNRVLTFLNPERDPLGAGYHILQSKIALGSGGVSGKGFLQGTQSHLNFLPEKQTDFIFTMLAEEMGLVGGLGLLGLFFLVLVYGTVIGLRSRNHFGRLVALGLTTNLFLYVFINIAMVMGLIPVGRRAAAADQLRRHGDADRDDRHGPDRLRFHPPGRAESAGGRWTGSIDAVAAARFPVGRTAGPTRR